MPRHPHLGRRASAGWSAARRLAHLEAVVAPRAVTRARHRLTNAPEGQLLRLLTELGPPLFLPAIDEMDGPQLDRFRRQLDREVRHFGIASSLEELLARTDCPDPSGLEEEDDDGELEDES